ncbi:hypothetical protein TNIN_6791 [Trichonephila inaurata madagascariensis]|uniref:Uncharacterized protein n=1 Tax=Trichonephila inaurata madagascariensis TaxID=2747483 RepID=A0A8X6Y0X7_9ARAC|nr:hypothetical protein TNIN_6791 [Trichonephila inaurata madagascariensis]
MCFGMNRVMLERNPVHYQYSCIPPVVENPDENATLELNENNILTQNTTVNEETLEEEIVTHGKKLRNPKTWKVNTVYPLKNSGKSYNSRGRLKIEIPAHKIQPPCGEKCGLKYSTKFDSAARQILFDAFWGLGDLQRQREYIVRHTHEIKPKYRYTCTEKYRALNTDFYFEENNSRIRFCLILTNQ